ncbi:MAG: ATP-dependent Clp protease adaptor ClpS [Anaerolineae bacterium]|nr:ATP-dependent Clp protease adaptor ClpS [Thermoflexales bacterium]MDW8407090.1 ATP-dependent Clp protease adaptor ClpS [Anaerolineae bacterium]
MTTNQMHQTITTPDVEVVLDQTLDLEPIWRVIIHNDDVTPFDFVIHVLKTIFKLGSDIAEHVTWLAHTTGRAVVCARPKSEAERLVNKAHFAARLEGYPLRFTLEPLE